MNVLFYVCSQQGDIRHEWEEEEEEAEGKEEEERRKRRIYITKLYQLTHWTMKNQFNSRSCHISIIQNISCIVTSIKIMPMFLK